jgi:ATP-binding cassette subfamily F protein uup
MNYLQLENISKSYGDLELFNDISFTVNKGDKVALIAKNGAGKTSLLHIVTGKDIADSGDILISKDIEMEFLINLVQNFSSRIINIPSYFNFHF